eukprot:944889-Alexandrium_andersonii.AAC.1
MGVRELRHDTTHGRTAMLASLQLRGRLRVAPALQRRFPWTAHALGGITAEEWVHAIAYSAYVGLFTDQADSRLGSMTVVGLIVLHCCCAAAGPRPLRPPCEAPCEELRA